MRIRTVYQLVIALVGALLPSLVAGQTPQVPQRSIYNRGMTAPLLVPNFEVPVRAVSSVRIHETSPGKLLVAAAGDDKVVFLWDVELGANQEPVINAREPIRWPTSLGRGAIKCLDLIPRPDNSVGVAFGGVGVRPSQLMYFESHRSWAISSLTDDRFSGQEEPLCLLFHPRDPNLLIAGHAGNPADKDAKLAFWSLSGGQPKLLRMQKTDQAFVSFLAATADGSRLATADNITGSIRLWKLNVSADRVDVELTDSFQHPDLAPFRGISWNHQNECLIATRSHGIVPVNQSFDAQQFVIANRTNGPQEIHVYQADNSRKLLSLAPLAEMRISGKSVHRALNGKVQPGRDLASLRDFSQRLEIRDPEVDGGFFLAGRITGLHASRDSRVMCYSISELRLKNRITPAEIQISDFKETSKTQLKADGDIQALSLSNDGRYVVWVEVGASVIGADELETRIRIYDRQSQRTIQVQSAGGSRRSTLIPIHQVRITGDELDQRNEAIEFGFATEAVVRGNITQDARFSIGQSRLRRFPIKNIESGALTTSPSTTPVTPEKWIITNHGAGEASSFSLHPESNASSAIGPIPHLVDFDSPAAAVQFRKGASEFLAIGYLSGEIAIWDVQYLKDTKSGEAGIIRALCRVFPGHEGAVTSLAVSRDKDATWLASAGNDGAISGWPLDGIEKPFAQRNELGVIFQQDNSGVVVKKVERDAPGFTAGFETGDRIKSITTPRTGITEAQAIVPRSMWMETLRHPFPGRQLLVDVDRQGSQVLRVSSARREALFTFYPMSDGRWLAHCPEGIYAASDDQVAQHFGWSLNLSRDGKSDVLFYPLDTFSDDYHSRHQVYRVMAYREPYRRSKELAFPPYVLIRQVTTAEQANVDLNSIPSPVELVTSVTAAPNPGETLNAVEVWCNGYRVLEKQFSPPSGQAQELRVSIPASVLRKESANTLTAVAFSQDQQKQSRAVGRASRSILVGGQRSGRIHYLGIGVTKLDHEKEFLNAAGDIRPLKYTANDAWHLGTTILDRVRTSNLPAGKFAWAVDKEDVTALENAPQGMPVVSPTRTNILKLLSDFKEDISADDLAIIVVAGHGFGERNGVGGFYFVARDTPANLSGAVTGEEFFNLLQKLPCPVMLVIDACRSGTIQSNRALIPAGELGVGAEMLLSCKSRQLSYEGPDLWVRNGKQVGHGVFTTSLIEAFSGQQVSRNNNGQAVLAPMRPDAIDLNRDGFTSLEEITIYVQTRVPVLRKSLGVASEESQSPDLIPSSTFPGKSIRLRVPK